MNRKIVSILVCTLLIFVVVSFVEGQTPNVTVTQIISPSNGSLWLYDPQVEVTATSPENDVYVHLIINKIQLGHLLTFKLNPDVITMKQSQKYGVWQGHKL